MKGKTEKAKDSDEKKGAAKAAKTRKTGAQIFYAVALFAVFVLGYLMFSGSQDAGVTGDASQALAGGSSPILARGGGIEISADEFDTQLEMIMFMYGIPEEHRSEIPQETVLREMARNRLIHAQAAERGYAVTDEKAESDLETSLLMSGQSLDSLKAQLAERGLDYGDFISFQAMQMGIGNFIEAELMAEIEVTGMEAVEYYLSNIGAFTYESDMAMASHILVGTEEEALEALERLEKGEGFAALAAELSTCPSSAQGGDLGYFGKGAMVPEFEDAAFALGDIGDITATPVKTQFGYHIIMLTGKKVSGEAADFEEVSEQISEQLLGEKRQAAFSAYAEKLVEGANIDFYLDAYPESGGVSGELKSDIPRVELFVMSHCPYGTQIEKGILPVVEALEGKIDFELKFCTYAMHGRTELDEQLRQYCIQEEQKDKLLPYLSCFLEAGNSEDCLSRAGVAPLDVCVASTDAEHAVTEGYNDRATWLSGYYPQFNVFKEDNEKYGVGGSPTLVINGKTSSAGRDPASLMKAICGHFNEAPSECALQLSSAAPSPGFGFGGTGASSGSCG